MMKKWYFVTKVVLTCCEKKCSSDREKLLKFETEGQEFFLTVGQNNFGDKIPLQPVFLLFLFSILPIYNHVMERKHMTLT